MHERERESVGEMAHSLPKPCIFTMYEDRAYKPGEPFFLKFGPYYTEDWRQHPLEDATLQSVLRRQGKTKEDVFKAMEDPATRMKDCYEGAQVPLGGLKSHNFLSILIRDGCFLLEVMHIMATKPFPLHTLRTQFSATIYSTNSAMLRHIRLDMLSVVNQIPLPFLQHLYGELYHGDPSFEVVLNKFLNCYPVRNSEVRNLASACHLLDAARMKLLPEMVVQNRDADRSAQESQQNHEIQPIQDVDVSARESLQNQDADGRNLQNQDADGLASTGKLGEISVCYSAVDLRHSFVSILPAKEGTVKLTQATVGLPLLQLPPILINRDSHVIFMNMVAYEQRIAEDGRRPVQPVSSYLRLLSDLLLTVEDARALTSQGIIDNQLGSLEDIVTFFRGLNLRDTYMVDMLSQTRKQINEHCQKKWISSLAELRRTFFGSRWQYWTFVGAILLLVLTLIQVFYAILAYHRPPK